MSKPSKSIDGFGIVASSLCALHCALSALLPGIFSALGLAALLGHEAEWGFTIIAIGFALAALLSGWRRHRSARIAVALGLGATGLLAGCLLEEAGGPGGPVAIGAGLLLVAGHIMSIRALKAKGSDHSTRSSDLSPNAAANISESGAR